jgi:hypothetical protein
MLPVRGFCHLAATNHPWPSRQIEPGGRALDVKPGVPQKIRHGTCLRGANLDENLTLRHQQLGRSGGDAAIGIEPVSASIERKMGVVKGYFRAKPADLGGGDVGWIRDDKVEGPRYPLEPV